MYIKKQVIKDLKLASKVLRIKCSLLFLKYLLNLAKCSKSILARPLDNKTRI